MEIVLIVCYCFQNIYALANAATWWLLEGLISSRPLILLAVKDVYTIILFIIIVVFIIIAVVTVW